MDKMEQALELEDVLKCCLVLKHSHSSRRTGTQLGCFQVAGSSHHNYQHHLELIAENGITWTKVQRSHPLVNHPAPANYFGFTQARGKPQVQRVLVLPQCPAPMLELQHVLLQHPWQPLPHMSRFCGRAAVSSDNFSSTRLSEDNVLEGNSLLFYTLFGHIVGMKEKHWCCFYLCFTLLK